MMWVADRAIPAWFFGLGGGVMWFPRIVDRIRNSVGGTVALLSQLTNQRRRRGTEIQEQ